MLNKYFKNNKAFTLIEFIIVMAIIGILVLLASHKFLDYVNKAKITQIKNDVKVVENWNKAYYAENLKLPTDKEVSYQSILVHINKLKNYDNNEYTNTINTALKNNFVKTIYANDGIEQEFKTQLYFYDERGLITNTNFIEGDKFYLLDKEEVIKNTNTKLKGFFITNNKGDVFYTDNKNYIKDKENIDLGLCRYEDLLQYKGKDYKIDDRGYITYFNKDNYVKQENGIFEVPGVINGTIVKGIADGTSNIEGSTMTFNGVFSGLDIRELKLPCTLEYIGSFAFAQNRIITLNTNDTPNLKEIEEGAFQDNPIKELTISEGVEFIGENAFKNVDEKIKIIINWPDSQINYSKNKPQTKEKLIIHPGSFGSNNMSYYKPYFKPEFDISINYTGNITIGNYSGHKKEIFIPEYINDKKVTHINKDTFKGKGIEIVHFPDSVEYIGDYAFAFNLLKEVKLPKNIKHVGNYAFGYNTKWYNYKEPTIKQSIIIEDVVKYNNGIDKETGNINKELNTKEEILFKEGVFKIYDKDSNIIDLEDLNFNDKHINKDKDKIDPATNEDFIFIEDSDGYQTNEGKGYYRYIGKEEVIKIPKEINGTNITNVYKMFEKSNLTKLKVIDNGQLTNTSYMFYKSSNLKNLDLSNFNTNNVTDMRSMFSGCSSLENLDLSSFNTEKVTSMSFMFRDCSSLNELNLSSFNTENVNSMWSMFNGCNSLNELDLSSFNTEKVTDMQYMFSNCSGLTNLNLYSFNTEKVKDMYSMFYNCNNLQFGIARNAEEVYKFNKFFKTTSPFYYKQTGEFINDIYIPNRNDFIFIKDNYGYNTNEGKGYYRYIGKEEVVKIPKEINGTIITNVYKMFEESNLTKLKVIDNGQLTNTSYMFYKSSNLKNLDLSNFNTSKVTNTRSMFNGCSSLNELDLSNFNTSKVTNTRSMFNGCSSLNELDLSNFNTEEVTDMQYMFSNCSGLTNLNLYSFNTEKVKDMQYIFNNCNNLQFAIARNAEEVYKFNKFFKITSPFYYKQTGEFINDIYIPNRNDFIFIKDNYGYNTNEGKGYYRYIGKEEVVKIPKEINGTIITNVYKMFEESNLTKLKVIDNGQLTNTSYMFYKSSNLKNLDLSNFNTSKVTNTRSMFNGCSSLNELDLSNFNTSKVTNTRSMFNGCSSLNELDLSNFNTEEVTDMQYMFSNCSGLTNLNLYSFNTEKVKDMYSMFYNCNNLQFGIARNAEEVYKFNKFFKTTSPFYYKQTGEFINDVYIPNRNDFEFIKNSDGYNTKRGMGYYRYIGKEEVVKIPKEINGTIITNVYKMFEKSNLTKLKVIDNGQLTNTSYMFYKSSNLKNLDLSNFNTNNVTDMRSMFSYCHSLTNLNLSSFNTENVTDMYSMFYDCSKLISLDLSNFNTSKVTNTRSMFNGCSSLNELDLSNFNTEKVKDMQYMFYYCNNLQSGIARNAEEAVKFNKRLNKTIFKVK